MRGSAIKEEIRIACHVHARLLDSFIALTEAELGRHESGFVEESLQEMLESLRSERKSFGALGGVVLLPGPRIEHAA